MVNGESHPYLMRVSATGVLDSAFTAAPGARPFALSVQRDGRILLGGFFFNVNGLASKYVARLMADGEVDSSFHPGVIDAFVDCVVALNNGGILVGGSFTSAAGATRNRVLRLNSDGSLDTSFDPGAGPNGEVMHIAPQADGKLLIAGFFTAVAGSARPHLARLNANGTLDPTFQPGAGTFSSIDAVAVAADTRIVVGGDFTSFGTGSPVRIARLLGDGVASPPPTPFGLAATAASASSLLVSWSDLPAEQGWKLHRSPDGAGGWVQIAALPWDVATFTDTGRAAATTCFYRVRASNAAGDSDYSPSASARTLTLYEQWKLDSGLSLSARDDADDDRDGVPLLLEYALGLDPAVASPDGMLVPQIFNVVLALSYHRFRGDVSYLVEASSDLRAWSASGVNQGSGTFPIAWKLIGTDPALFLRLRVTLP